MQRQVAAKEPDEAIQVLDLMAVSAALLASSVSTCWEATPDPPPNATYFPRISASNHVNSCSSDTSLRLLMWAT
jgi:hypothetical protein